MNAIAIVDKGLEKISLDEIKEKLNTKGKISEEIVVFDIKKEEYLCRLIYTCQSLRRIILLLKQIKINSDFEKNNELLKKQLKTVNLDKYKNKKIKVVCERHGKHDFNSIDVSKQLNNILREKGFKISLKENDVTIYLYINQDKGYLGVDFSGRDLSKRDYRIFTTPGSLKGTLAFALIKVSGYKEGDILLDPYCESGIIPIEAAIYAIKKPINFYKKEFSFQKINPTFEKVFEKEDKKTKKKIKGIYAYDKLLKNINNSKKNAKIAGVEKSIEFSKTELEWLDTKFEKKSVDKIVTKLPSESKRMTKKMIEKIYQEFFYQTEYILKNKGVIVVCSQKNDLLKKMSKKKKFKIKSEQSIFSGQQEYKITLFQKNL